MNAEHKAARRTLRTSLDELPSETARHEFLSQILLTLELDEMCLDDWVLVLLVRDEPPHSSVIPPFSTILGHLEGADPPPGEVLISLVNS